MEYIKKTLIVSSIFSFFLLTALQLNRIINQHSSEDKVLGITTENDTALCNLINSLKNKYCVSVVTSTTTPTTTTTNSGQTNPNNNISSSIIPRNILADNVNTGTVKISFVTNKKVKASIFYGTNVASLLLMAQDSAETTNHNILLTNLKPNKTYFYKIVIGNDVFDNNSVMYSFKASN